MEAWTRKKRVCPPCQPTGRENEGGEATSTNWRKPATAEPQLLQPIDNVCLAGPTTSPTKDPTSRPKTPVDTLAPPLCDHTYVLEQNADVEARLSSESSQSESEFNLPLDPKWRSNPKSTLSAYILQTYGKEPKYRIREGVLNGKHVYR